MPEYRPNTRDRRTSIADISAAHGRRSHAAQLPRARKNLVLRLPQRPIRNAKYRILVQTSAVSLTGETKSGPMQNMRVG
jgi:hypothetical protein